MANKNSRITGGRGEGADLVSIVLLVFIIMAAVSSSCLVRLTMIRFC